MSAWVMAAVAAANVAVGFLQENSAAAREAKRLGVQAAAIDTSAGMQQEALVSQSAAVIETQQQGKIQIEKNLMKTEADQKVAAAASGTAGNSIDVSQRDVERTAAEALQSLDTRTANALNKIEQNSRDINIQADRAKVDVEDLDTSGRLAQLFASGVQGYFMGRSL